MKFRSYVAGALMCSAFASYFAYADGHPIARIASPKPDAIVHNNSGNPAVTVAVSPPLHAGDRMHFCQTSRLWRADTGSISVAGYQPRQPYAACACEGARWQGSRRFSTGDIPHAASIASFSESRELKLR